MTDWTEAYDPENPAVVLYRMLRDNPDWRMRLAQAKGWDGDEPPGIDEDSFREMADYCEQEVTMDGRKSGDHRLWSEDEIREIVRDELRRETQRAERAVGAPEFRTSSGGDPDAGGEE